MGSPPRYPRGPRSQPQSRPWSRHLRFFQTKPGRTLVRNEGGSSSPRRRWAQAQKGRALGGTRHLPHCPQHCPLPHAGTRLWQEAGPGAPRLFVQLSSHPQATGSCLYALACRAWSGIWTPAVSQPRANAGGRRAAGPSHVSLWAWPLLFWTREAGHLHDLQLGRPRL